MAVNYFTIVASKWEAIFFIMPFMGHFYGFAGHRMAFSGDFTISISPPAVSKISILYKIPVFSPSLSREEVPPARKL